MDIKQKRVSLVLERMLKLVNSDEDYAEMFEWGLDNMLDDIADEDGFGTECQCDPRGDARNNDDRRFSISYVEGIDD
jgi:hypothetical protein